ncbi:hypothetical protein [Peribacillus kribbensis]|uniref:hypothetical protein n=1 Tax=Peribacillus kribbensis TaxID=356658 RepID=UPI0006878E99|nr:hypothetical protein [Peribacillus kribbensis]
MLTDKQAANWLIEILSNQYPRHMVDQLKVVQSVILKHPYFIDEALSEMRRLRLTSANDLRDIAITLEIHSRKKHKVTGIPNEKYKTLVAPERREDIYFIVLQGGANQ